MKLKIKKNININKPIKEELPFSESEIFNILKIVDIVLSDEEKEKEIWGLCDWHEPIPFEQLEELHRKINIFLQQKSK